MKKIIFKKLENIKRALEKHEKSAYHGLNPMEWPSAIRHPKSAERHFSSVEWHSTIDPHLCHFQEPFRSIFNLVKHLEKNCLNWGI